MGLPNHIPACRSEVDCVSTLIKGFYDTGAALWNRMTFSAKYNVYECKEIF